MRRHRARYAKCGLCGAWRPKREMRIVMTIQRLWPPNGPLSHTRECREGHTAAQRRRRRDRWLREMVEWEYRR